VPEEVERDTPAQRHGRDRPERAPDVGQGLLDAEGDEDYPRNHRQVQQAVGVSRQPRGPDAYGHDRLAQGYDDYEAVAHHEVPSVDLEDRDATSFAE
jgi:hypothetical protein